MSRCLISLAPVERGVLADPGAVRELFGTPRLPHVEVELARLHTFGLAVVGRTSLSGVQRKLSLGLDVERSTLRVSLEGRQYVLKPPSDTFPELPANEHLTMHIARRCGVETPAFGLVPLASGELSTIVRRFDRPEGGGKLRMEDFCQLSGRMPADKYRGSCELCARVVRRFASEPLVEARKLVRSILVSWWVGNGDLHLKNLALLTGPDGRHRLAPAYDVLCTRLYIPDDPLALPLEGHDRRITARHLRELAGYAGLGPRVVQRLARELVDAYPDCQELVARSFLSEERKDAYARLLGERVGVLEEVAAR